MKKQALRILAVVSLFATLSGASVFAQFIGSAQFEVPFDFTVRDVTLRAGKYRFEARSAVPTTRPALVILNEKGEGLMLIVPNSIETNTPHNETELVFTRYGDRYFLSQLWTKGARVGQEFPESDAELELAEKLSPPETATISVRKP